MKNLLKTSAGKKVPTKLAGILMPVLVLFPAAGDLAAQEVPDLIVKDIQISRDADDPTRLVIRFADDALEDSYREWFDNEQRDREAKGLAAGDDDVFGFSYDVYIDGRPARRASGSSSLPRSGRRFVITPPITAFVDRVSHDVKVEVRPWEPRLDRDLNNNSLGARLKFIGKTVGVAIPRIEVRDDCDNLSEGDWLLLVELFQFGGAVREHSLRGRSLVFGINSGEVRFSRTFILRYEQVNNSLGLGIELHAVDCDMDSPFSLLFHPGGPFAVPFAIKSWITTCGGEEWWEVSGEEDSAGSVRVLLEPDEWHGGTTVSVTSEPSLLGSPPSRREDCGSNAFTIDFRIEDPPTTPVRGTVFRKMDE